MYGQKNDDINILSGIIKLAAVSTVTLDEIFS